MTLTLNLSRELETQLQAKAAARGLSLDAYVLSLAETAAASSALEDAVTLYVSQQLSQGEAAHQAGVSRAAFLNALNKAGVSVFQYQSVEELLEEARG